MEHHGRMGSPFESVIVTLVGLVLPGAALGDTVVDADVLTAQGISHIDGLAAAIEDGGTVTLRGTFVLSDTPAQRVHIDILNDVELVGETVGGKRATIVGGYPFWIGLRFTGAGFEFTEGLHVQIRNIDFRDTTDLGIWVAASDAFVFTDNRILGMYGRSNRGWRATGIQVGFPAALGGRDGMVRGEVVIEDSIIDLNPDGSYGDQRGACLDLAVFSAELTVEDCTCRNYSFRGMVVVDILGEGGATLRDNTLVQGTISNPTGDEVVSIKVQNGFHAPDSSGPSWIEDNHITVTGSSIGIQVVDVVDAQVIDNKVIVAP